VYLLTMNVDRLALLTYVTYPFEPHMKTAIEKLLIVKVVWLRDAPEILQTGILSADL